MTELLLTNNHLVVLVGFWAAWDTEVNVEVHVEGEQEN